MKKKLFPILGLVLAAALLFGLWYAAKPEAQTGSKALTVEVIHGNGEAKTFDFRTDAQTLADALVEQEIVELILLQNIKLVIKFSSYSILPQTN